MNLVAVAIAAFSLMPGKDEPVEAKSDGMPTSPPVDKPLMVKPPVSRFEMQDPVGGLPAVPLDWANDSIGLAQQATRGPQRYQARIMWIDATANIDRYNTEEKIVGLVRMLKEIGFNTLVLDVKPISGQVIYNSKIAPKLTEWRGRVLPPEFDPLPIFTREAKKNAITLCVSLNAFSEGHNLMKTGPGYSGEMAKWQTTLYETKYALQSTAGPSYTLATEFNKLPADDSAVAAFNDGNKLPAAADTFFWIAINRAGMILQAESGADIGKAKVPSGGSVIVGTGRGADFLRSIGYVNTKVSYTTTPDFVKAAERMDQQIPLMMNPHLPQMQDYARSIVRELLTNYDIDGIVYDDRLRFGGMNADFSDFTQAQFESYVKRRVVFPDDVFRFTLTPGLSRGVDPGPLYEAWMTFRAQTMRNYTLSVRQLVRQLKPKALFGVYAGSWYGEYQRIGTNWAAPETEAGFWFLTQEYAQTGIAPQLDFLITGCYYPTATIKDAMTNASPIGFTVEAAGQLTNRMVRDQTWAYAGLSLDQFRGNPDGLARAIQAACGSTQGVMIFDLSHDFESMAGVFRTAFQRPVQAPHSNAELLVDVRKRRAAVDKQGAKDPPIVINNGSAGIGQ